MAPKAIGYRDGGSGSFGFKFTDDGRTYLGNTLDDILSITGSIQQTAGSSTFCSVTITGSTIGHTSDTDLITLADGTVTIAGDIHVGQYIRHSDDTNTHINFTDDKINLKAGNLSMITMEEKSSAPHEIRINNGGNNIDLVVEDNSGDVYFIADASTSRVGIKKSAPDYELDVNGTIAATTLDISGDADIDGTLETDALSINGTTITATGTELNYVDGVTSAIQTQLDAKAPSTGIAASALASDCVIPAKIATSVAGDGLSGGGGSALSVNVDDSTIDINSDTLRVKPTANMTVASVTGSLYVDRTTAGDTKAAIVVDGDADTDVDLIRVKNDGAVTHGFAIRYLGDGSGDANRFALTMDNQGSGNVDSIVVDQDGQIKLLKDVIVGTTDNPNHDYVS